MIAIIFDSMISCLFDIWKRKLEGVTENVKGVQAFISSQKNLNL